MVARRQVEGDPVYIQLRKWHMIVAIVFAVSVPSVSLMGAYYSKETAVKDMIAAVDQRVSEVQLENERRFVKREELENFTGKLDQVLSEVSEIRGYLKRERRASRER